MNCVNEGRSTVDKGFGLAALVHFDTRTCMLMSNFKPRLDATVLGMVASQAESERFVVPPLTSAQDVMLSLSSA